MDYRTLQSWATEMVKLSVGEWLEAQHVPALRVKKPPYPLSGSSRALGIRKPTDLTLANYPQELKRRYPKLKMPQQQAQMAKSMAKKIKAEGVSPKDVGVRQGPDIRGSAAGDKNIQIDTSRPLTVGHELGHVRDSASHGGKFHGERGVFGFGGDPKSMIKSEVSATRQAFKHAPKGIPRKSKAEMLAATGTYLQSLGVKGEGDYRRALGRSGKTQLHRGERTRIAREKAKDRAYRLEKSFSEKVPKHDTLSRRSDKVEEVMGRKRKALEAEIATLQKKYPGLEAPAWRAAPEVSKYKMESAIRKAREAAGRPVGYQHRRAMERLVAHKQKQLQKDPATARARLLAKTLAEWRSPARTPETGPLEGVWGARLMKKKERRYATAKARAEKLLEQTRKEKNPFVDPTFGKMTGAERQDVRRYIENVGGELEKHFGPKKAKIYREEVLAGLKKPTLKGFPYIGKREQILKALETGQGLEEVLERGLPPRPGLKKPTREEALKTVEEKARGKAKEVGGLLAKGKKKAGKGLLDLLKHITK